MRALIFSIIVLAGCREAKNPSIPTNASTETFETATLELVRSYRPDYTKPLTPGIRGNQLYRTIQQFERVCVAGDPRACIRGSTGYTGDIFVPQITANCQRGDELSCRYIAWKDWLADEPHPRPLSVAQLRRGCAAGLRQECNALFEMTSSAEKRFGAEMTCWNAHDHCEEAAESYLRDQPRDAIRARDLYEFKCQDYHPAICFKLAQLYARGVFPEPRQGRGAELHRYACDDNWPDELRAPGCPPRITPTSDYPSTP